MTATLPFQRKSMPASGRRLYIAIIYLNGASEAVRHTRAVFYTMRCLLFYSQTCLKTYIGILANLGTIAYMRPRIKGHRLACKNILIYFVSV